MVQMQKMLVAVINHALNDRAIRLKERLSEFVDVIAIDSGSELTDSQRSHFDLALPNVYYAGCLDAATEYAVRHGYSHLWIWASDVDCEDMKQALDCGMAAFAEGDLAVYAPSATYSFHRQMAPRLGRGLSRVSFADGFCFAATCALLRQACADFNGNKYGFGFDIHLGFLALRKGLKACVDHRYCVRHPQGAGYSVVAATREWKEWQRRQPMITRLFHRLARKRWLKSPLGILMLTALPWAESGDQIPLPATRKYARGA